MTELTGSADIDFSPIGFGVERCRLTFTAEIDNPDRLLIHLSRENGRLLEWFLNSQDDSFLSDRRIAGVLDDARHFEALIGMVNGFGLASMLQEPPSLDCYVPTMTISADVPSSLKPGAWECRIANLSFRTGDAITVVPPPAELAARGVPSGWIANKIIFNVSNREWSLTYDLMGRKERENIPGKVFEIVSGTLCTDFQSADTWESITTQIDAIDRLLSLALSATVRWTSVALFDAAGAKTETRSRTPWLAPFRFNRSTVVDQWQKGILKSYLEIAFPNYVSKGDWMRISIDMLLEAQNELLETRGMVLNALLDRIQQKVNEDSFPTQIDENLEYRFSSRVFKWLLHRVLRFATSKWTHERTEQILHEINRWNRNPSFPEGVRLACTKLGLRAPEKRTLGHRHKLIHLGEFDRKLREPVKYWAEIESLVVMMLLRLLGYSGEFYHLHFGHKPVLLSDVMVDIAE